MKKYPPLLFIMLFLLSSCVAQAHVGGFPASNSSVAVGVNGSGLEAAPNVIPGTLNTNFYTITPAQLAYYHYKGLNVIRLPFTWERMQLSLGATLTPTYLGYVQSVVNSAAALGMTVILDCHNGGYYNGVGLNAMGGPTYAQFANLWSQLATVFAGNPGILGYDIMNEPHSLGSSTVWPAAAQAAITAIRGVDTKTAIYVEGDAFASSYNWINSCANCGGCPTGGCAVGGNSNLLTLTDPSNRIVYSAHSYADYNSSGTYPVYPASVAVSAGCNSSDDTYQCAQKMGDVLTVPTSTLDTTILTKRYAPFLNWCAANHVACHLGETGVPKDDSNWLTTLNNSMLNLQAVNILFTYWSAGTDTANNTMSVEPTYGLTPAASIDTVQMAVLTKYSGGSLSTIPYIAGSATGTSGTPQTMTANYNGNLLSANVPFTLSISDNGGGGTITSTPVTCSSAGFNCSQSFSYTPPGIGQYNLSLSSSASFMTASPYFTISTNGNLFNSPLFQGGWSIQNGATITSLAATDPNGGNTAALLTFTSTSGSLIWQNVTGTGSFDDGIWIKSATGSNQNIQMAMFNSTDGFLVSSTFTATTSWQCFSWARSNTANSTWYFGNAGSSGAAQIYAWKPLLVTGSSGGCP